MTSVSTIAVDLDDVLSAGAQGFVDFSNKRWGTNLTVDDFTERWAEIWEVDLEEEKRRAHIVYDSGIMRRYKRLDRALPVLTKLSETYKLVVLTSRVRRIEKDTMEWLDKHFPGIFTEVHFAGFYDELTSDSHTYTKAEISREIGADYLIDDQLKHCFAAASAGIEAILFGDYSWNRTEELPAKVTRVKNWQEVGEYFARKSK